MTRILLLAAIWQLASADHFDITYTPALGSQVERIKGQAERAYRQVSSDLGHELSLRPLLVLFGTRCDLQRAVASGTVPGNREHILLALDAPAPSVYGDLVHELAHAFVFDIVPSSARSDFPRWIHEGIAEFERGEWADGDSAVVRELLRTNTLPALSRLPPGPSADMARLDKVLGHAAFGFLVSRAGQDSPRRVLLSLREGVADPTDAYLAAAGLSAADFDQAFGEYLRGRFAGH